MNSPTTPTLNYLVKEGFVFIVFYSANDGLIKTKIGFFNQKIKDWFTYTSDENGNTYVNIYNEKHRIDRDFRMRYGYGYASRELGDAALQDWTKSNLDNSVLIKDLLHEIQSK